MPLVNVEDYRAAARRRLPRFVFDYLDGGAEDEIALRRNRAAFEDPILTPRVLNPVAQRDQSVGWLGKRLPTPIVIAPTGLNGLFWHEGDLKLARAARRLGIPFTLSTASNASIEQVAATGAEFWFQLYVMHRALADELVDRAFAAGASQLVLTVDVPVGGKRERDLRNRFVMPFRLRPDTLLDIACHPRWLWSVGRHGAPAMGNLGGAASKDPNVQAALLSRNMDASFSWDDLARLRDRWPRPLLVKGILHPADIRRAAEIGVDGIVLSNHGGRQLDAAPAPLSQLEEAVSPGLPILLDSGIRRGTDIVKARLAGADAVMIGRAALYGLAVGGEDGVVEVVKLLQSEIDRTQALMGLPNLNVRSAVCVGEHKSLTLSAGISSQYQWVWP
ncbi:alpha-hydroxy-acid oxidizing protein [Bosea sp. AS-1]|uniref:alpha-hydroxy-acid oxidizing protein n=1 Tax=Bosea sp. AS-1 TaxID=2015316 RepID=UPI000B77443E|nr:alpha-hydroxy-acid oxidizing protein [Bosea sp. AS-1]